MALAGETFYGKCNDKEPLSHLWLVLASSNGYNEECLLVNFTDEANLRPAEREFVIDPAEVSHHRLKKMRSAAWFYMIECLKDTEIALFIRYAQLQPDTSIAPELLRRVQLAAIESDHIHPEHEKKIRAFLGM